MRAQPLAIHRETEEVADKCSAYVVNHRIMSQVTRGSEDCVVAYSACGAGCHGPILAHRRPADDSGWPGTVQPMGIVHAVGRRRAAAITLIAASGLLLAGCEKPGPGVSVFAGTTTEYREAVCWAFESDALEPGDCAQDLITEASTGEGVARVPVVPGETIGISVDPKVADAGWTPVIGQQRLTSTPLETTYFRFTYPDLQEVPQEGVLLQIVAGRGESTKGIWVFRLNRP